MLDIESIRKDTPGLAERLYFDNAGASLPAAIVNQTIKAHLDLEAERGGYVAQFDRQDALEAVYGSLAKLFGGSPTDYALTGSAVEGWNMLFTSIPINEGDNIITTYNEYCSNYVALLQRSKIDGFEIRVAEAGADGALDIAHLESLIDQRTRVISASGISSSSGQIVDMAAVGKIAKKHDVLYLLDACQAVGQTPVNVEEIGCDMFTATSRKFLRGPRGVGFLYASPAAIKKLRPLTLTNNAAVWTARCDMEVRDDARIFEGWERSVALQLGFGAALDLMLSLGPDAVMAQAREIAAYLREQLSSQKGITVHDPEGPRGVIVTFSSDRESPEAMKERLEARGIVVNVASVVHTRLDLEPRGIESLVRASPQYYTTKNDVDNLIAAIIEA